MAAGRDLAVVPGLTSLLYWKVRVGGRLGGAAGRADCHAARLQVPLIYRTHLSGRRGLTDPTWSKVCCVS